MAVNPIRTSAAWLAALLTFGVAAGAFDDSASSESFDDLELRSIGPAVMGGRIDVVAVQEDRPSVLYVGTASGGLWKTVNMGTTWEPIFDRYETSSIGDVAIAPSDPDIVWVGTGEPNNRQSSSFGYGVYRSGDAGRSFRHVGLDGTGHIGKVVVHPRDPDLVYVAALGPLWAASPERGVFRTRDGGKSWEKVLFLDEDTGAVDLAMDPRNPDILYAATYQRRRVPWGFAGGGPGSGIHRSTDGGDSWHRLEEGLPEGPLGRIGIDVFASDPRIVFAIVEHHDAGGVYRSADRGESWEKVSNLNPRPMYYSHIFVDPGDVERVYVLGADFYYSDDGGRSFVENEEMTPTYDVGVHGDHHTLWIDPSNSSHLVLGGDGGLYFSWDRGRTWDKVNNLPIAQFYAIAVDVEQPYNVYGGAQDNHSWFGPSATRSYLGILNRDWRQINFGDGMYQQTDPTDVSTVYTSSQGGNLVRLDRRTGDRRGIKPHPGEGEDEYRFHWTSPLLVSKHDPRVLYLGGNRLFVSRDRGESWIASPDLTWNEDRDELPIMGAVPDERTLSRHDGVADWGTITTLAESPLDPGTLWVGTDDGRIQVSRDGGARFESVEGTLPGLDPRRSTVSRLVASSASAGRAYASLDRHQLGDFAPHLFVTEDFGKGFREIGGGLPALGWINVVVEHPRNQDLLFAGTETGLFVSVDRGASFRRMTGNFPVVPVDDLVIHPRDNDLVVGTHGRSIYVLDDLTPLERHRPGGDPVELFDPRAAVLFLPWKDESYSAQREFVGENPAMGALVTYYLAEEEPSGAKIVVSDAAGELVRTLEGPGAPGFHRVAWDLRTEAPEGVRGGRGPAVPPGRYRLSLSVGDVTRESAIEVVLDPRLDIPAEEIRARYEFLLRVNRLRERLAQSQARADSLEKRLEAFTAYASAGDDGELARLADQARKTIEELDLGDPSPVSSAGRLFAELDGSGAQQGTLHAPTPVQLERLELLEQSASEAIGRRDEAAREALRELNGKLRERGAIQIEPLS